MAYVHCICQLKFSCSAGRPTLHVQAKVMGSHPTKQTLEIWYMYMYMDTCTVCVHMYMYLPVHTCIQCINYNVLQDSSCLPYIHVQPFKLIKF